MKASLALVLALTAALSARGQTGAKNGTIPVNIYAGSSAGQTGAKNCAIPVNIYAADSIPDVIFPLSNGEQIALSGREVSRDNEKLYTAFALAVCSQRRLIGFWDSTAVCRVEVRGDTLLVEEFRDLPAASDLSFTPTVWLVTTIHFIMGRPQLKFEVNKQIRRYTQMEIEKVLAEFEKKASGPATNHTMELAYRLFMAALSGDAKAREYFDEFKAKFGPLEGEYARKYDELTAMLKAVK